MINEVPNEATRFEEIKRFLSNYPFTTLVNDTEIQMRKGDFTLDVVVDEKDKHIDVIQKNKNYIYELAQLYSQNDKIIVTIHSDWLKGFQDKYSKYAASGYSSNNIFLHELGKLASHELTTQNVFTKVYIIEKNFKYHTKKVLTALAYAFKQQRYIQPTQ